MILRRYEGDSPESLNFNNVTPSTASRETLLVNLFSDEWYICNDDTYYNGSYLILRPQCEQNE